MQDACHGKISDLDPAGLGGCRCIERSRGFYSRLVYRWNVWIDGEYQIGTMYARWVYYICRFLHVTVHHALDLYRGQILHSYPLHRVRCLRKIKSIVNPTQRCAFDSSPPEPLIPADSHRAQFSGLCIVSTHGPQPPLVKCARPPARWAGMPGMRAMTDSAGVPAPIGSRDAGTRSD